MKRVLYLWENVLQFIPSYCRIVKITMLACPVHIPLAPSNLGVRIKNARLLNQENFKTFFRVVIFTWYWKDLNLQMDVHRQLMRPWIRYPAVGMVNANQQIMVAFIVVVIQATPDYIANTVSLSITCYSFLMHADSKYPISALFCCCYCFMASLKWIMLIKNSSCLQHHLQILTNVHQIHARMVESVWMVMVILHANAPQDGQVSIFLSNLFRSRKVDDQGCHILSIERLIWKQYNKIWMFSFVLLTQKKQYFHMFGYISFTSC